MNEKLKIDHQTSEDGGVFYLFADSEKIGHLTYDRPRTARCILTYVEVDPAYRGRGFARRLIDEIADFARQEEAEILPTCGVARAIMTRSEAYDDVLVTSRS